MSADKFGWENQARQQRANRAIQEGRAESVGSRNPAPLTFGKHKGVPLAQVPHDYLKWCLKNLPGLSDIVRSDMQFVIYGPSGKRAKKNKKNRQHQQPSSEYRTGSHYRPSKSTEVPFDYEGGEGKIEAALQPSDIPF